MDFAQRYLIFGNGNPSLKRQQRLSSQALKFNLQAKKLNGFSIPAEYAYLYKS
jgi:hypothetical protein